VVAVRPGLPADTLAMLLFGMINRTLPWLKAAGALDHHSLAPVVAETFFGGLGSVKMPSAR
jgi:hypothetical protein